MTELGPGREFDLIREMRARWGSLSVGIGDDAAILQPPTGEQLVVSVDTAIEGIHFKREWLSMREIGFRAVTAALSDLAAMAAAPRGVLVALALSDSKDSIDDLADGIGDAVRAAGTVIVGGNLARGPLSITTTVIGSVADPMRRAGARPGDDLYVTGKLGGPAAALRLLESGNEVSGEMRARFALPEARIAAARWLVAHGATAGIDISDGLGADAAHLAAASDVALEIQVERVPVFPGATEQDALAGGEEYELLVAMRGAPSEAEFVATFGIPLTHIGRAVSGAKGAGVHFTRHGARVAAPRGHDHFSR